MIQLEVCTIRIIAVHMVHVIEIEEMKQVFVQRTDVEDWCQIINGT
jgi:hypothetical protein